MDTIYRKVFFVEIKQDMVQKCNFLQEEDEENLLYMYRLLIDLVHTTHLTSREVYNIIYTITSASKIHKFENLIKIGNFKDIYKKKLCQGVEGDCIIVYSGSNSSEVEARRSLSYVEDIYHWNLEPFYLNEDVAFYDNKIHSVVSTRKKITDSITTRQFKNKHHNITYKIEALHSQQFQPILPPSFPPPTLVVVPRMNNYTIWFVLIPILLFVCIICVIVLFKRVKVTFIDPGRRLQNIKHINKTPIQPTNHKHALNRNSIRKQHETI